MRRSSPFILFCAAAGPHRGFGHLIRCGVLADALGVRRDVALRGSLDTVHAAVRQGWTVHDGSDHLVADLSPDLVIIDEPSGAHASDWVRQAHAIGVPAVTVHDLGLGRVTSDLSIDGSITRLHGTRPADLQGPAYAILDPAIAALRARSHGRLRDRLVIALGGGAHVRDIGLRLATELSRELPKLRIDLAVGFAVTAPPALPRHCRWLRSPRDLKRALATASMAVVGGGITLYEACALGTPTIAIAVVPAQRLTIHAFDRAGAVIDASASTRGQVVARVVDAARMLAEDPSTATLFGRRARQIVDARGTARVVRRVRALLSGAAEEWSDAA